MILILLKPLCRGPVQGIETCPPVDGGRSGGLDFSPSLVLEAGVRAHLGGVNALPGAASGAVPTQLVLLAAARPQRELLLEAHFWPLSHHSDL